MNDLLINRAAQTAIPYSSANKPDITPGEAQANFADTLKSAIDSVNNTQIKSDEKTNALAQGNIENLHDVMITAQKSSVALETTVQVQKKVVDAYNEVMRMSI
ncbi:flagellar hook-basal body complex protein FliE [Virgibacillus ainsalahensis]